MTKYNITKTAVLVMVMISIAIMTTGCGKKKKSCPVCPEDEPLTPYTEAALVVTGDTAWVDDYANGRLDGFIISDDGSYTSVMKETNEWVIVDNGTLHAEDGVLTVLSGHFYPGMESQFSTILPAVYTLSNDGDTLRITDGGVTDVFIKQSGVIPVSDPTAKSRRGLGKKGRM